jgi:hypothetical protein
VLPCQSMHTILPYQRTRWIRYTPWKHLLAESPYAIPFEGQDVQAWRGYVSSWVPEQGMVLKGLGCWACCVLLFWLVCLQVLVLA